MIINHPGRIRVSYEPVGHFLGCCVRQSARIVDIRKVISRHSGTAPSQDLGAAPMSPSDDPNTSPISPSTAVANSGNETASLKSSGVALLAGDRAVCRFRFLYRPEYISLSPTSDSAMVMREGRTKGVGKVLSLSCPSAAAGEPLLKTSHTRT